MAAIGRGGAAGQQYLGRPASAPAGKGGPWFGKAHEGEASPGPGAYTVGDAFGRSLKYGPSAVFGRGHSRAARVVTGSPGPIY
eukprot:CAMPEP_0179337168 /NCGR_PEP_ID=MMETSP0797-20121207/67469_1 /TAXON_ID=47934 /ORGANISM="Dinophysis acuminata, Strain DAEP01" /LENGTH=82 /DNA_ID=CAMNT_0021050777 /DNA_START=52 /DNA_END=297 /DNA_ORIENTATION=-